MPAADGPQEGKKVSELKDMNVNDDRVIDKKADAASANGLSREETVKITK